MHSPTVQERRRTVEEHLGGLGKPRAGRQSPPPEGRLSPSEQSIAQLRSACEHLGPVFESFGRYLSSRLDLLPRRECLELAAVGRQSSTRMPADGAAVLHDAFGAATEMLFASFDHTPRRITRWTQQHDAWLSNDAPVVVTIVRPDAQALLDADLPLLSLVAPWLDASPASMDAAVADFAVSMKLRLDQTQRRLALARLAEFSRAGGPLDAPRSYPDVCAENVLTAERIDGLALATALGDAGALRPGENIDPATVARQLASAWVRLTVSGHSVLFDFDLDDVILRDGRLVLVGGALEPMSAAEGPEFLKYLLAGAIDDPDRAFDWIVTEAAPGSIGLPTESLRRRLRQAVPFRDGEWSGDDRLAERLFVHWRATRAAEWHMPARYLRLYRGVHALSVATTALTPYADEVLTALHDEQWRMGQTEAQDLLDPERLMVALESMSRDFVQIPQKLDEILTAAATGRLRITAEIPDADDRRIARNRTVSLVASLVTMVAVTFVLRHVTPAHGSTLEWVAAMIVLMVGGWLLVAAARL